MPKGDMVKELERRWFNRFHGKCHYGVCWTKGCAYHPTAINDELLCFKCFIDKKVKTARKGKLKCNT